MIWGIGGDYPPTSRIANVYTFALLARSVLNFMRIEFCDILYIGIVYSNPDLKILELNE